MSELPYVISTTLERADTRLVMPSEVDTFRESLDDELRGMGKKTLWVAGDDMRQGVQAFCEKTALPVVTLDDRYTDLTWVDGSLSVSRMVDQQLQDAGYGPRLGAEDLDEQFDRLGQQYSGKEVVLVDDVVFSGEMAAWVTHELSRRDVKVSAFYGAIAIGEGAIKLDEFGVDVLFGRLFPEVDDQLVEIDFTALPGSGRKVAGSEQSALYFDNRNGRPDAWMSISKARAAKFCVGSLERNLRLLKSDAPLGSFMGYGQGGAGQVLRVRLNEEAAGGCNA